MWRIFPRSVSLGAVCLFASLSRVPASAHPLGNFTVNHFVRLRIGQDQVRINYVIDMAEIPAFQELRKADENGDGKTSPVELDRYFRSLASQYAEGLSVTIDGARTPLRVDSQKIATPAGAGGLSTIRLEYELLASSVQTDHTLPHHLQLEDANDYDRIGWREIIVVPGANTAVFNSSAFSNSLSNELRSYPPDMLAAPLAERWASLYWTYGPVPSGVTLLRARNGRIVTAGAPDRFAELISIPKLTLPLALLGLLIAAVLGATHALSPGHGKTVVGAYLAGSRGTPKHAVFLGLTVTVTHTAGVFALGLLTLFASQYILPERLFPVLSFVSGALLAFIGLSLFFRRLAVALGGNETHLYSHAEGNEAFASGHTHAHFPGGKSHSHLPPGMDGEEVTWWNLLALGISGGLLPCPSALIVLLSAIALHRIGYGLLLVLAFSVGLAATLTGIGLVFVYAGRWLSRFGWTSRQSRLRRSLPVFSALVVACLGLAIAYEAAAGAGFGPALLIGTLLAHWQAIASGHVPLASLGVFAVLGFGLILGFKHATEADHVVAVSSIVSEHRQITKVAIIGALWGAGHTITLVLVGVVVLLLRVTIPETVANFLEFVVALMIIGLSGTALTRALRGGQDIHMHQHAHGGWRHAYLHFHEEGADHDKLVSHETHRVTGVGLKPLLVGAMHGLAGSAALTLLVLTQVSSVALGLSYLFIFGVGSILGMMLVSVLIGLPFALSTRRLAGATLRLQTLAGVTGVAFGCWYAYNVSSSFF